CHGYHPCRPVVAWSRPALRPAAFRILELGDCLPCDAATGGPDSRYLPPRANTSSRPARSRPVCPVSPPPIHATQAPPAVRRPDSRLADRVLVLPGGAPPRRPGGRTRHRRRAGGTDPRARR